MDEHNPPMALPNGHVYSAAVSLSRSLVCSCHRTAPDIGSCVLANCIKIIRERASENDGVFVCKFTGEAYRVSECRKLFVL